MKNRPIRALAVTMLFAAGASPGLAQSTEGSHNPAVKNSAAQSVAAPARGSSSFTESQARGRLSKAGYSHISKIMKDSNGAWMGTAVKGRKHVEVILDYKGNITSR